MKSIVLTVVCMQLLLLFSCVGGPSQNIKMINYDQSNNFSFCDSCLIAGPFDFNDIKGFGAQGADSVYLLPEFIADTALLSIYVYQSQETTKQIYWYSITDSSIVIMNEKGSKILHRHAEDIPPLNLNQKISYWALCNIGSYDYGIERFVIKKEGKVIASVIIDNGQLSRMDKNLTFEENSFKQIFEVLLFIRKWERSFKS